MNRAFSFIEGMIVLAIVMIFVAIVTAALCSPSSTHAKPIEEQKLNIGLGMNSRIIVLPTGERVLLITGGDSMAACCLLPPIKEEKVGK